MLDDLLAADGLARAEAVRLGPFLVQPNGALRPAEEDTAPGFSVRWRGRTVRAWIEAAGGALAIEAMVGRVPSTADAASGPAARAQAFGLVRALPAHLPAAWEVRLLPDHHIGVAARRALPMPALAADLVAGLTEFLLGLGPYLDLLEDAGAGFAAGPGGSSNTCPG